MDQFRRPVGHIVLTDGDHGSFASLRRRPTPRHERHTLGKSLRREVPRSSLGNWLPSPHRRDTIERRSEQHVVRSSERIRKSSFAWSKIFAKK